MNQIDEEIIDAIKRRDEKALRYWLNHMGN